MINVVRSQAPRSNFAYNDEDIKAQIKEDFYSMCFLCEEVAPKHAEVEHFYPVKGGWEDKKHEWENLLFCCEKCNKIKSNTYNKKDSSGLIENELLKNWEDNVEQIIRLSFNIPQTIIQIDIDKQTPQGIFEKAKTSKELLDKIYNGKNTTSLSYIDLQKAIIDELADFMSLLKSFFDATKPTWYKEEKEREIAQKLSKKTKSAKSSFVGFKRYIIRNNPKYQHFEQYFD